MTFATVNGKLRFGLCSKKVRKSSVKAYTKIPDQVSSGSPSFIRPGWSRTNDLVMHLLVSLLKTPSIAKPAIHDTFVDTQDNSI